MNLAGQSDRPHGWRTDIGQAGVELTAPALGSMLIASLVNWHYAPWLLGMWVVGSGSTVLMINISPAIRRRYDRQSHRRGTDGGAASSGGRVDGGDSQGLGAAFPAIIAAAALISVIASVIIHSSSTSWRSVLGLIGSWILAGILMSVAASWKFRPEKDLGPERDSNTRPTG
jgi:hypothetical protein